MRTVLSIILGLVSITLFRTSLGCIDRDILWLAVVMLGLTLFTLLVARHYWRTRNFKE